MCIIVDNSVAFLVLSNTPHDDFVPVLQWLRSPKKKGCVVYGGRLANGLGGRAEVRTMLRILLEAGRAKLIKSELLEADEKKVSALGVCKSNDIHVISLARVSGARTLCTNDDDLCTDFTNHRLISKPRGSVYRRPNHVHLLRHTQSCHYLKT